MMKMCATAWGRRFLLPTGSQPALFAPFIFLLTASAFAQKLPDLYHDETHGDPPYLSETGWRPQLNGRDLAGWHAENQAPHEWFTATSVVWKRVFSPLRLTAKAAPGDRIVNGKEGKTANLIAGQKFGSFELYLEFLLAKGSNSGVYLHGLYEIQIMPIRLTPKTTIGSVMPYDLAFGLSYDAAGNHALSPD